MARINREFPVMSWSFFNKSLVCFYVSAAKLQYFAYNQTTYVMKNLKDSKKKEEPGAIPDSFVLQTLIY